MRKVPAAASFAKAFEAKYGAVSSYGPLAYEATNILLDAIKTVGQAGPRRDSRRGPRHQGLPGHPRLPDDFDAKGDVATPTIYIYQVKGTDFEQVKIGDRS